MCFTKNNNNNYKYLKYNVITFFEKLFCIDGSEE